MLSTKRGSKNRGAENQPPTHPNPQNRGKLQIREADIILLSAITMRARSGNRRPHDLDNGNGGLNGDGGFNEMGNSPYVSCMVIQFARFSLGWALFSVFLANLDFSLFWPNLEAVSTLAFIRQGSVLSCGFRRFRSPGGFCVSAGLPVFLWALHFFYAVRFGTGAFFL